jgi:hypothetical protein
MMGSPLAHVAGIPVEETLGSFGPVLLLVAAAAWARLSAHLRNLKKELRHANLRRHS